MEMRKRRKNWLLKCLALGLAVAALGVPTAQARVDGSTSWKGPGPGDKAVVSVNDVRSWPGVDPTEAQPTKAQHLREVPTQVVSRSDGFDLSDAGIGAGTLFAVMLLTAGGMAAARRTGREAIA